MVLPVVVFSDISIDDPIRESLADLFAHAEVVNPETNTPDQIQAKKAVATAWITRTQPLVRHDLERMPNLKIISAWGVGYNHIDLQAATERGVSVCINPVLSRSMAEAALTFVLALSKRLPLLERDARSGRRTLQLERGLEIRGKTLGLVGFGRIGRETGELAQRLEMIVIAYDPYLSSGEFPSWCKSAPLEQVLRQADFLVLATPLTSDTRHLITGEQLSQMKPSAYLVNIARGAIVNEDALYRALVKGTIAGAAIDVWENEPLSADHPLLGLDNVIATPHRIGATRDGLKNLCQSIQDNILLVLDGKAPLNVVNPKVLKRRK